MCCVKWIYTGDWSQLLENSGPDYFFSGSYFKKTWRFLLKVTSTNFLKVWETRITKPNIYFPRTSKYPLLWNLNSNVRVHFTMTTLLVINLIPWNAAYHHHHTKNRISYQVSLSKYSRLPEGYCSPNVDVIMKSSYFMLKFHGAEL